MAGLITNVGDLVTGSITWMGAFIGAITKAGNEILLLFILVPLVGLGAGLLKRMLHA